MSQMSGVQPQESAAGNAVVIAIERDALRVQLRDFFERIGLCCLEANTTREARDLADRHGVLVLVTDSPVQVIQSIARVDDDGRPALRLLMISGDPEYINRAMLPDPAIHFIEKPFAWCELKSKICSLLTGRIPSSSQGLGLPCDAAAG